ncbi:MAG TPA: anti-sigma factor [Pseudolabrys sp.]|jgi:anti-sigma-K factor RskA
MSDVSAQMPEDDLLAAELALGVLADAERAAAQSRAAQEPSFAALVAAWEERLAPLAAEIADLPAPPQIWERVTAAINADSPAEKQSAGWWQSLAFWRGLSLATGALAAACIGALIYLGNAPQNTPLTAGIDGGGHRHFVATIDTRTGNIAVVPAAYSADATREPELWLIPADGKPRPLGMLRADRAVTIKIPSELAALTVGNAVLAVSLEPRGGSPTGQPTGPVIATGKLTSL